MTARQASGLGKKGERLAQKFLEQAGYQIIGTNVKLGNLEIDLIASHRGWLYFFEIKTKSAHQFETNDKLISQKQLANLKKAAHIYAGRYNQNWEKIKFDLLAIYINEIAPQAIIRRYHDIFS